jgi:proline iminopeptidase
MRRLAFPGMALIVVVCFSSLGCANGGSLAETDLWPPIEPYETGYLKVSDLHEIYYELCGNPKGKPVFVLHGGPGSGISPYYRRFFDPEKYFIVLHDQRGAGKSKPYGEIKENTTQHLVEDIEKLRLHLKVDDIILFGGSWGSTLGLAYGETYPENVSAMVLRGIFTATREEIDHFYHGGVRAFFPETYDMLIESVPEEERKTLPSALLQRVQSEDSGERDAFSRLWTKYEYKIAALVTPDELIEGLDETDAREFYAFALFENYYMTNGCFLEEGQLLRNADRLKDIPITLVNGRYDMICPPVTAYRLHKKLPRSKLVIVEGAGHWMGDPPIQQAMLVAMRELE